MNLRRLGGLVAALGLALPATGQSHGTAIAIVRAPGSITVAADSKLSWLDSAALETSFCKIRRVGDCWFAAAGLLQSPGASYDALRLAEQSLRGPGGIVDRATAFELNALPAVRRVVRDFASRAKGSGQWGEVLATPLTVFFFGFEGGRPVLCVRQFSRDPGGGEVTPARTDYAPGLSETVFVGSPATLSSPFFSAHPGWRDYAAESLVRLFVEFAGAQRRADTGGPTDVLVLEPSGPRWIRKKTNCPG